MIGDTSYFSDVTRAKYFGPLIGPIVPIFNLYSSTKRK